MFFHCLYENQVVLPEYYQIFLPENGYLKNSRGGGGAAAPNGPYAYGANDEILFMCVIHILMYSPI